MIIVGSQAPDFTAKAVYEGKITTISLSQFNGRYVLLFFYPLDFSYICPSEMHALQDAIQEFEKRNVQIIAASVDSVYTHDAWLKTPRNDGGIQGTTYPVISDINQKISRSYGVLDESVGVTFRGVFVIDKAGLVQYGLVNTLSLGRNVKDLLRMIDAIQYTETHGGGCPANWQAGQKSLEMSQEE